MFSVDLEPNNIKPSRDNSGVLMVCHRVRLIRLGYHIAGNLLDRASRSLRRGLQRPSLKLIGQLKPFVALHQQVHSQYHISIPTAVQHNFCLIFYQ